MQKDFVFTSESVTEGHPDKLCDRIADAIVDQFLIQDPYARIVTECAVARNVAFVAARFAAETNVDIPGVARRVIGEVGYQSGEFRADDCSILTSLIAMEDEVRPLRDESAMDDRELERLTVRNQITLFGYACDQTPALMPLPIWQAHRLARRLGRACEALHYLTPDGTTQVGVEYRDRRPVRIHSLTLVVGQKSLEPGLAELRGDLIERVVDPVFRDEEIAPDDRTRLYVNPNGPKYGGGPPAHSGMTGRKTAADTYGGFARHSGSALSGKDPLRIDRVAAYAARYAARNVVAAGLARECEVQLSYSVGLAGPVSLQVDTFGTGKISDERIGQRLEGAFDFRLGHIVRRFNLRHLPARNQGFYRLLAAYGQVGRVDLDLPWEEDDLVERLQD
ncbi:MAG: methionine adenosyltransferase [Candidatus Competibacteraceae bacterium]|nr:methionine adenosyltransferase [Candidatus Competibacteraceae bacterium]